jgi:uncharacterized protein YbjQ (UPF0145 family)
MEGKFAVLTALTTNEEIMKQTRLMLGVLAIVALTQAGCATQVKSLPLQPVAAHPAAGSDVAVYFGSQKHPAVQRQLGDVSYSVRIARATDGAEASCNKALSEALGKLRADAKEHGANAVINVKTRFHSTESVSDTHYTCGVSTSAAAIAVKGERVLLQSN